MGPEESEQAAKLKESAAFRVAVIAVILNYFSYCAWTLLNKRLFRGFPLPLFATSIEMFVAGVLSYIAIVLVGVSERRSLSWVVWRKRIMPLCISRSVDIGLGNFALLYLSVPYQQVMKSLIPIFVCIFEVGVGGKVIALSVWLALLPIVGGSILASLGEGEKLATRGLVFQLCSCVGRAMKCVINGMLLDPTAGKGGEEEKGADKPLDKYNILLYEAPMSGVFVLGVSLVAEWGTYQTVIRTMSANAIASSIGVAAVCGALMFIVQLSYLQIIASTTPLTCQVLMNFKMILLITAAIWLSSSPVNNLKLLGFGTVFAGGVFYSWVSSWAKKQQEAKATQNRVV